MNFRTKLLFIQVAFGLLFLTFGVGKIVEPSVWIALVPDWVKGGLPLSLDTLMFYAGCVEIFLAIWIVLPIKAHIASLVAFFYYSLWAIMGGISPTGIRDIALTIVLLGLTLIAWPKEYKLGFDD